jgi:hypothetical protein
MCFTHPYYSTNVLFHKRVKENGRYKENPKNFGQHDFFYNIGTNEGSGKESKGRVGYYCEHPLLSIKISVRICAKLAPTFGHLNMRMDRL